MSIPNMYLKGRMHDKLVWCVASDATVREGSIAIIKKKTTLL